MSLATIAILDEVTVAMTSCSRTISAEVPIRVIIAPGSTTKIYQLNLTSTFSRVSSCEFHFKQSVNRRRHLKAMFKGEKESTKFQQLTEEMLNAQTEHQFGQAVNALEEFIAEKPKRKLLKNWLPWWIERKHHIFRAFKKKSISSTNLAEVIHSTWVTSGQVHLDLYDSTVDDITDFVNTKQMVKGYCDGSYKGGTGKRSCLAKNYQKRSVLVVLFVTTM